MFDIPVVCAFGYLLLWFCFPWSHIVVKYYCGQSLQVVHAITMFDDWPRAFKLHARPGTCKGFAFNDCGRIRSTCGSLRSADGGVRNTSVKWRHYIGENRKNRNRFENIQKLSPEVPGGSVSNCLTYRSLKWELEPRDKSNTQTRKAVGDYMCREPLDYPHRVIQRNASQHGS